MGLKGTRTAALKGKGPTGTGTIASLSGAVAADSDLLSAFAKTMLKEAMDYRLHRKHGTLAKRILKTLEGRLGKTNPRNVKLANDYARDVLGNSHYAPWLHVYTALARTFKEGWIPDNYYKGVVVPKLKGEYGTVSTLKPLTNKIFRSDAIPDIASFVNGLFLTTDNTPIPRDEVAGFLFRNAEKVAFKIESSLQGKGVFFFDTKTFDVEKIRMLPNGVFQKYIVQHSLLETFAPNSVATLRITSAVDDDGRSSVRSCYLRLGRHGDTHVQSKSHIRVPVNLSSGELSAEGYLTNWLAVNEHPDTGVRFSGRKIPCFSRCLSTVLELHKMVPFARCVGWDVTVDSDENVQVMEWNAGHNDIKFGEATQGPCFADLKWERLSRA